MVREKPGEVSEVSNRKGFIKDLMCILKGIRSSGKCQAGKGMIEFAF